MDGTEDEREIFVIEASKVEMEKKTRQGHFSHILSPFLKYIINHSDE